MPAAARRGISLNAGRRTLETNGRWHALRALLLAAPVVAWLSCEAVERRTQTAGARAGAEEVGDTSGAFFARDGVLYRRIADEPIAWVAVAGAGPARDTLPVAWPPGVKQAAGFVVGDRIAGVAASADGTAALFWTSGVHALVGLVRSDREGASVLDFLLESAPVAVLWAPVPRYVVLLTTAPEGDRGLRAYDVETAAPLALPWEQECALPGACSVVDVRWEGGTLLIVSLQTGAGEVPVPYEVDVQTLMPPDLDTLRITDEEP